MSGNAPAARTRADGKRAVPGGLSVEPVGGDAYRISVRGHTVLVDQPTGDGGDDRGPTPTELLIAALAGCVAYYAGRYLARHGLPTDRLRVDADYEMAADRPARIAAIRVRLHVSDDVPEHRLAALLAVVSHCTVHNTLANAPAVDIELSRR